MLIVIIILTIIIGIFMFYLVEEASFIISIPILAAEIIALICCINSLVGIRVIDEKIELYTNQNKQIEEKVEMVVKEYMNYEGETFKELKSDSYITLVNLYPELKSDEMIKQQINLYASNNEEITSLKEQKLNKTIYKWWIYFGK